MLKPLIHGSIQSPLGPATELFGGRDLRGVVNHEFAEVDCATELGVDYESNLAEIVRMGRFVRLRARCLHNVISRTRQGQATLFSSMTQHNPTVLGVAGAVMERSLCERCRLSWIVARLKL